MTHENLNDLLKQLRVELARILRSLHFSSHSAVIAAYGKEFARTGHMDPCLPILNVCEGYTSFSRIFALVKSISATTITMNSTTVPAL